MHYKFKQFLNLTTLIDLFFYYFKETHTVIDQLKTRYIASECIPQTPLSSSTADYSFATFTNLDQDFHSNLFFSRFLILFICFVSFASLFFYLIFSSCWADFFLLALSGFSSYIFILFSCVPPIGTPISHHPLSSLTRHFPHVDERNRCRIIGPLLRYEQLRALGYPRSGGGSHWLAGFPPQ